MTKAAVTLTGPNTFTGGTSIIYGWLQIGDGTVNGKLGGAVEVDTANGLIFDVASTGSPETFSGVITSASGDLALSSRPAQAS